MSPVDPTRVDGATEAAMAPASPGPIRQLVQRFRQQRVAMVALGLFLVIALLAILAGVLAPYDPTDGNSRRAFEGLSWDHLLGTDDLGRDVFTRVLYGARVSLRVSVVAVLLALLVSLPLALVAGYHGRWTDAIVMRVMDAMFTFPPLILALVVRSLLGDSEMILIIAIAIVFVPGFIRLIRGQVLSVRAESYVEASRSIGTTAPRIVTWHVLPNIASPLIVQASQAVGFALLFEAGLSFLGLGAPPPTPTWGGMLSRAFNFVYDAPGGIFAPGIAITLTVLCFNLIGDGLRDALVVGASPRRRWFRAGAAPVAAPAIPDDRPRPVLDVRDLHIEFFTDGEWRTVVHGAGFSVDAGRTLGLVGESGCGKTVSALSTMGLLAPRSSRVTGSIRLAGRELVGLSRAEMREVRGREIAMVFQDPTASLNPAFTIGNQLIEAIRTHHAVGRRAATLKATELLERVGIPDPGRRLRSYPHELSGGMRQRAMIAMALSGKPKLLIADEPTTAVDVTIQAQLLELLRELQSDFDMAVVFVTHDLGIVAEMCDEVAVMYAGEIVEHASAAELFECPRHPYTEALIASLPQAVEVGARLAVIPGQVPQPGEWPAGCRFNPRCRYVQDACRIDAVPLGALDASAHLARCLRAHELTLGGST
ncbi:MAG: dipeptide/oligopeptide/nickel ABC transporter permease/ATP-binding protein [Acidimicrobiia bacterium]|nr:dipeptide/oligopeptide/nickel ABC transporter permease/ATP-binding protein [Acidimicrobiia bacterium]